MNPQEVAMVLTAIASIDDRLDPDQPRVAMWCATLAPNMTFEFAKAVVVEHYATKTSTPMPAHLNEAWKKHLAVERQKEQERLSQIELGEAIDEQAKEEWFRRLREEVEILRKKP